MFFSTSSPIKGKQRADHCSLDASLLSPDSSYVCYPAAEGGAPCSCRRSTRLLLNGYYGVSEDSFSRDEDGNVSLTPCRTSVSYKENPVRVFRRRRRPRGALARLLSDVTESCQSWLDERVFRGVFGKGQDQDRDWDQDPNQDRDPASLDEPSWSGLNSTELDDSRHFTYDHSETPPPPDKVSPPPSPLRQEEDCSEMCQSNELIPQSLGGLSEVPPPSADYSCCPASPERAGLTMKALLLLIFILFIFTAVHSGCPSWSATVASAAVAVVAAVSALMLVTRSGPMSKWRKAKTEDITSGNE
ncbi:transmembrane protein 71 isoform X2 [Pungitius pungitius]|uniref:transmembrane protein 71 isoform X2 n=1 Tax=Pungitius pungitius TaxID=134920 RepID=UPI0018888125|nr:transmembrane protein 71 isoform X2 [Pungitius pungitius]